MSLASNGVATQEAHTPGRLECGEFIDEDNGNIFVGIYASGGKTSIADAYTDDVTNEACNANARRLAAAWNVLAGLPTELIERIAAEQSDRDRLKLLSLEAFSRAMDHPEISNFNPKL